MYPISYLVPIRAATIPNNIIMMYLKGNNYVVQSIELRKMYVSAPTLAEIHILIIIELWQNSTPIFGAAAFCTTKIYDFRTSLTQTFSTTLAAF